MSTPLVIAAAPAMGGEARRVVARIWLAGSGTHSVYPENQRAVGVAAGRAGVRAKQCAPVRTIGRDRLTTPEVQPPTFSKP